MKLSVLIEELQFLHAKHGDVYVECLKVSEDGTGREVCFVGCVESVEAVELPEIAPGHFRVMIN